MAAEKPVFDVYVLWPRAVISRVTGTDDADDDTRLLSVVVLRP